MKWLSVGLALVILLLQYRVWFSEDGVRELDRLKRAVAAQRSENDQLAERNQQLAAEVRDLKTRHGCLEERARSDLGMIASHETFYQVVTPSTSPGHAIVHADRCCRPLTCGASFLPMRYWLIMPAAGVGRRFGTSRPKQYAPLLGRTVIEWALTPFLADPACAGVVVALAAEDPYWG